jgi:2-C-methyl-D-erythritol 4-phosphate cytidylyltransferase
VTARTIGLILVGAGSSRRMSGIDKVWADLGGRPLVWHSVHNLAPCTNETVLVLHPSQLDKGRELVRSLPNITVVAGGIDRRESVTRGIQHLPDSVQLVAVHDVARPFAPPSLLIEGMEAIESTDWHAAVPGLEPSDTVKKVDSASTVVETLDRSLIRAIQTPQVFLAEALRDAHARWKGDVAPTDDAQMLEVYGYRVRVFPGSPMAFKVTTEWDLVSARTVARDTAYK